MMPPGGTKVLSDSGEKKKKGPRGCAKNKEKRVSRTTKKTKRPHL